MMISDPTVRKKYEAGVAVDDARRTIRLAKVRCLPFDALLTRLRSIFTDNDGEEVIIATCEFARDDAQDHQLADIVRELASRSDSITGVRKDRLDRRLGLLLKAVSSQRARPIALEFLEHRRGTRRDAGFNRLELELIDDETTKLFWSLFQKTLDTRFLKVLLRHPLRLSVMNPMTLAEQFVDDDYWKMRVVEATLRSDFHAGTALAPSYAKAFIWASGRLGDQRLLPFVSESFRIANDKALLIGITAWAFGKLHGYNELLALEPLLDELEDENKIDWDAFQPISPEG